ncbi:hypothetical protein JAO76_12010 [Pontibacter sp. BT310]|uniref:VWA domain-containing protein n=1 Tax=Pontibacter populi TaxID=890055 RepID=A0ABS6XE20_9BACT|nr:MULTISPECIES: hypothetical protein [Pontibacter]MBJ6118924.1 hypothetical protein [Pontibacter sp. BT310]MBR0571352.1 hypothetical protein [Microvirga sp. STS03]MBW3365778.1 hypothetical protein [Pontibacter populi]
MLLISGCYKKQSANEETEPVKTTPAIIEKNAPSGKPATPPETTTPSKVDVNVYLEISNGMKGFMPTPAAGKEATTFQNNLVKLISEVQDGRYVDEKGFYLAKEDAQSRPVLDSVSYNTMKSYIVSGIKDDVRGTPLPAMLKAALQKSIEQGAVSVIISDFIHGPDPRDQGQFISLDSDIRSSLREAEHQGLAIAILGNTSEFFGNYYPAVKKPEIRRSLNGGEIPYYIWVIGKQEDVQVVTNKVLRNLPAQQAYFGFEYESIPYSALLKEKAFKPAGVVYCSSRNADPCTSVNLQPEKKEPVEFTIGLDLSQLPLSMQTIDYLKKNLKVTSTGSRSTIVSVTAADETIKATPDLAKYTHFVRVRVPELTANSGTISVQLPQVTPAWISGWSTDNDNNPAADPKKTYQLTKIVDGVQALYRDQNDFVFNATIEFKKAD